MYAKTKLKSRFLMTVEDAQLVRELRNQVRDYMTRDSSSISPQAQEMWFRMFREDIENHFMYMYYDDFGCFVGYCYLKRDETGKMWGSLAVKPEFQGKGYGSFIYRDMIETYGTVFIEIYADNEESLRAAQRAGFKMLNIGDKVVTMKGTRSDLPAF